MGNCLSASTNKRDGLHKLEASLECKSTQTDKYNEDESGEKAEKERHFHVHYPKAVIVGDNGKIIVGKNKRKKSNGSLSSEIKQQHLNTTDVSSSSSSYQSENEYNEKSYKRVARPMDIESSTSDSEKISDDSEEERSRSNAMVKSKQCKTEAEIKKVIFEYKEDLMKRAEAKTKSLEKHLLGKLNKAGISDQSKLKKLQRLDTLTKNEKSSNMYIVT
ncbi:uncharacterized protein LOC127714078 [Mytilus californianus]|uniref:uncharacterized protein LOC127714078 n=1 Tax=Mytilus californianus TaxID=6549 RepID=UPI002247B8A3|nr:uncharacterized protein LOC127714078 [Mytilus californianus]XP_052075984.1 uncharacterized protein LOC127714078 [Mytilus californianus]XP_052075985.1 uncharacterized protein LOC127714078 [Mytilus californianus]XP_052075987.1 uncharacterized protein LOC127714078 [Mytilus californianus]